MNDIDSIKKEIFNELTTEQEKRSEELDKIIKSITIKFSKSKIRTGKINPCKPFDSKIFLDYPLTFGDALSLWFAIIDTLADDKRIDISDVKKNISVKLYGVKTIYENNQTPGINIFTKMKYRTFVIDIRNKNIGTFLYDYIDGKIK